MIVSGSTFGCGRKITRPPFGHARAKDASIAEELCSFWRG